MRATSIETSLPKLGLLAGLSFLGAALAPEAVMSRLAGQAPPPTIELIGVVRDFRGLDEAGGHPDFQRPNDPKPGGAGLYQANMVGRNLGLDGNPLFIDGGSYHVRNHWEDSVGRRISRTLYDPSLGDTPGTIETTADHGCGINGYVESVASFNQWFRDVPGVNVSMPLTLTFVRQLDGTYVFDDKDDPIYSSMGGFFPIDGQLYGNYTGQPTHNFHFTFELHCRFTYDASAGHVFKFLGDDDVWVFINGKLVIDIGGHHYPRDQHVEIDRLGLTDGETYGLDFFYAERRTSGSNCRITTTLALEGGEKVMVSTPFD